MPRIAFLSLFALAAGIAGQGTGQPTPGTHQVRFVYAPLSFLCGLAITALTATLLALYTALWLLRRLGTRDRLADRS